MNRWKEIIKIRAERNEKEIKKQYIESMKLRALRKDK
jgi:hypothetical protein